MTELKHPISLTCVKVVCRECLSLHGRSTLSHIVELVNGYLNTLSLRWTVERACYDGLPTRALKYLAARDPDWISDTDFLKNVVENGHVHVLQWLGECYPDRILDASDAWFGRSLMDVAASSGHLPVLQWLHTNNLDKWCSKTTMDRAAAAGHLDVVRWLDENRSEGCTKAAMTNAAVAGHLSVVQYLHDHRDEGCYNYTMDSAAARGQLAVVQFFHEHRRQEHTREAMCCAASNGHLEMVQWLHANRSEDRIVQSMRSAARNGQLEVVKWTSRVVQGEQLGDTSIVGAAHVALEAGHDHIAEYLAQMVKRPRTK